MSITDVFRLLNAVKRAMRQRAKQTAINENKRPKSFHLVCLSLVTILYRTRARSVVRNFPLAAGLRVVYKNGAFPSIRFKNRDDDAAEEVLRLETWRADHIADYLEEKLREKMPEAKKTSEEEEKAKKTPELKQAGAAAAKADEKKAAETVKE